MIAVWMLSLSHAAVVDRVAAVVNDDVIALSEVYEIGAAFVSERCPPPIAEDEPVDDRDACVLDAELEILDVLLRRALVKQELRRLDLTVTVADVDKTIDDTVRSYNLGDREALKAEVQRSGKTWSQYRQEMFEYLRTQTFQARILAPRITINDDELRDRFQRESRKMRTPVALIEGFGVPLPTDGSDPTPVLDRVDDLVTRINSGEIAWADAVATYDEAEAASLFGREVAAGELAGPLDDVVKSGQVGPAQGPIMLNNTLYVLSVRSTGERSVEMTFEEAKEQLRNVVFTEKLAEAEEEWYQRARRQAAIVIRLK